jgi:hypothetical protein
VFRIIIAALGVLCFVLIALPGCADKSFTPPCVLSLLPAPTNIIPESLATDYFNEPEKSSIEYSGRRFNFGALRVESVSKTTHPLRLLEDFILVGNIKFRPRYSSDMDHIIEGTVLEIIGTVQGLQYGYVLVTDCWFSVVSGEGVTPGSY